jgi:hypothetical protein
VEKLDESVVNNDFLTLMLQFFKPIQDKTFQTRSAGFYTNLGLMPNSEKSTGCLVLEASALWPGFVANLVALNSVKAIWLTARNQLFQNRIKGESNFCNLCEDEQHLIQKFLNRTLFYNKHMREEVERLGFMCIDVELFTAEELLKKYLD